MFDSSEKLKKAKGIMYAFILWKGSLTMEYFDNFDDKFLNKYKKFENRKEFIDMFFYL
jgi:hypothetical protein